MKELKELTELSARQMTRKEFLQFGLLAIAGLFGFKNFITYLLQNQQNSRSVAKNQPKSRGFGSSKFGD